jgi:uncharacterized surface protein with fasciclin (FAS1) repeats
MYAFLALNLFTFTACDDDDSTPEALTIVETAQATADLSILVDAVTQAGLASTLQGPGPFTVFAPTNTAFQALLNTNPNWNQLSDIDNATLTNVLLFHVLATDVKAADLADSYVTSLAAGPNDEQVVLQVDVTGGVKFNGSTLPLTTDVNTSNGTVHIINEVMMPPTVVDLALNNPNFSSLVAALTRSDLTTDYVSLLSGPGPFTVFAPTNTAFETLLGTNPDWNTLADIPVGLLQDVLNYHVLSGNNVRDSQLTDNQEIDVLGGRLTVDLSNGAKLETTSGQSVNISTTNVQGINGVVHVVDMVLLP